MIDFPSVSFCKKFIFESHHTEFLTEVEDGSSNLAKDFTIKNTKDRDELFHFVNHEGNGTSFECNTIDGKLKGLPCVFPAIRRDCAVSDSENPESSFYCESFNQTVPLQFFPKCISLHQSDKLWCATRVFKNNSLVPDYYGHCSPECDGSVPHPTASKNMAGPLFEKLWHRRLFDLDVWGSGHCLTYTPHQKYPSGRQGQLYAYMGNGEKTHYLSLKGYDIYLHSKKVAKISWLLVIAICQYYTSLPMFCHIVWLAITLALALEGGWN